MSSPFPLQAIPIGVGDFFSKFEYTTTFLVIGGQTRMLIDAPSPFFKALHESTSKAGAPADAMQINDVLLTHLHGDHANGLEGFGFCRKQFQESPGRPRLYLLPEVLADLWERRLRGAMGRSYLPHQGIDATHSLDDYFEPHPIEPGEKVQIGDLSMEVRRTRHPVPCCGCKIRYGGRTLGYAGDTDFEPAHIEWLSDADLIFHEVNAGVHTKVSELESLPADLQAKIRLVHLSDDFDRGASKIEPAEAGRAYRV